MNVNPWLPPDRLSEPLLDMVLAAEDEALGVLVPALEEGYDEGRSKLGETAAIIAAMLATRGIRDAWATARAEAVSGAVDHWLDEAARVGIASRVSDPYPPVALVDEWEDESVALYERLRDEAETETAGWLDRSEEAGVAAAVAAQGLRDVGLPTANGRMRGRGTIISSDRLWTLAAIVALAQQRDAKIGKFIWTSTRDSRVRPLHQALHGRSFKWSEPPSEGYPGEPVNCRCWAVGVIEPEGEESEDD